MLQSAGAGFPQAPAAPVEVVDALSRPVLQYDGEVGGNPDPKRRLRVRAQARQIWHNVKRVNEPHLTAHDGAESLQSACAGSRSFVIHSEQMSTGALLTC